MRYSKGTFLVVPNKGELRGKPPELQVLFFWLCDHSDDNGSSYPSHTLLAQECGMSVSSVQRYLEQLIKLGLLKKTPRKSKEKGSNTNLYQVLIKNPLPPGHIDTPPSHTDYPPLVTVTDGTQPIGIQFRSFNNKLLKERLGDDVNVSKTPLTPTQPFNFQTYRKEMEADKNKAIRIIGYYFLRRKISFNSLEEVRIAIKRHLRAARAVGAFTPAKVEQAFRTCETKHNDIDWSLDTVLKKLTNS